MNCKAYFLTAMLSTALANYAAAETVNFQDIDGSFGTQSIVPSEIFNNNQKVISNFAGVGGLTTTISSSSSNSTEWTSTQNNFHFGRSDALWLSAENKRTINLKFNFSHPISGTIDAITFFGDDQMPERLVVSASGGASAGLIDNGSQAVAATATTTSLEFLSGVGTEVVSGNALNNLLSFSDISFLQFEYQCEYTDVPSASPCGSLIERWQIEEILLTTVEPPDNSSGVSTSSNVVLNFNQNIQIGAGTDIPQVVCRLT